MRTRAFVDEVADAAVLQSAVLPINSADTPGLQVYVTSEFADLRHSLAGDWYDVMALPGKRTYLAVGDGRSRATGDRGHGPGAQRRPRWPAKAYRQLGYSPKSTASPAMSATASSPRWRWSSRTRTRRAVVLPGRSPGAVAAQSGYRRGDRAGRRQRAVLGHKAQEGYADASLRVEKDDLLVMYTDGLVETTVWPSRTG